MLDFIADPDFLRDSLETDFTAPVPCALCGGTDAPAWRVVSLDPSDIAYGPVAPARGICDPCYEGEAMRWDDLNLEGQPEFNGAFG